LGFEKRELSEPGLMQDPRCETDGGRCKESFAERFGQGCVVTPKAKADNLHVAKPKKRRHHTLVQQPT
jgi:hypothetical protein